MTPAIEVKDLSVRYRGAAVPSLSHVSLAIPAGQWLTVIGPNGSGKTTLIHALCGLCLLYTSPSPRDS